MDYVFAGLNLNILF